MDIKKFELIIDNVRCGYVFCDSYDIEFDSFLYGGETLGYYSIYLFLDGKIIYHIDLKKDIFISNNVLYVESFRSWCYG